MANSLIVPPYRAALLTNADGSPVVREDSANGPIATERQWYMFWRQLGEQLNTASLQIDGLEDMVTFGNHLDRPDPGPWPDGALYVEWDRGSVLYQNQGGVWIYIAGIMYGTLSPDQRPTDLGPSADVGFQFRTTTDPARAFAWNGGQWVETTPIRYGTHAERLAAVIANLVSGMLWMETDRGSVIYQNQGGTWLYLAGTMWGTLSPDQRPADLGIHDAGFDFRTTVPPPREFIWNQVAWVEVTPVPQTPWASNIDAAGFNLSNAGKVGIGTAPTYPLDVLGYAGSGYTGGAARFSGASSVSESGFHLVNTGTNGRDYAIWSTGNTSGLGLGNFLIADATAGAVRFSIGPGGNTGIGFNGATFQFQLSLDSAGKPATSTWSVVSDIRLKQNIQPVKDDSLAILDKLDWIRYEYNGLASTPKGAKGIGLVAQALREQLPEAVRSEKAKLNDDDAEEADVLAIDYHYVLVHSARAIQQLNAEVKRLAALIGKP